MQGALEALVMERQAEGETKFPPFVQRIFERGIHEGELKGRLEGKRDTLLRLLARAGIALTDDEAARVQACDDPALLDRWVDNVLGAKTARDVLS
jgi:predicted transposase YdaD